MRSFALINLGVFLFVSVGYGYIPPVRMILQKMAESSGAGIYSLEQEVDFQGPNGSILLHEVWVIENAHSMRLTVTGEKGTGSDLQFQYIYSGGQRWQLNGRKRESTPISSEFIQRFFHYKHGESIAAVLMKEKILPEGSTNKKPLTKKSSDIVYVPEPFVRMSRSGGVINYALGEPSTAAAYLPGLWIEQDQFVLRKLRFFGSSSVPNNFIELIAESYREFHKGLFYPEKQTIRWNNNTVVVRLLSLKNLTAKSLPLLRPSTLDVATKMEPVRTLPNSQIIEEFYSRFR